MFFCGVKTAYPSICRHKSLPCEAFSNHQSLGKLGGIQAQVFFDAEPDDIATWHLIKSPCNLTRCLFSNGELEPLLNEIAEFQSLVGEFKHRAQQTVEGLLPKLLANQKLIFESQNDEIVLWVDANTYFEQQTDVFFLESLVAVQLAYIPFLYSTKMKEECSVYPGAPCPFCIDSGALFWKSTPRIPNMLS